MLKNRASPSARITLLTLLTSTMNQNVLIGIIVAIILIGGGAWLLTSSGTSSDTASSTPSTATSDTTTDTTTTTTTTTTSAAMPTVTTGTLVVSSNSSAVLTGNVTPNGSQSTYWFEYGKTSSLGSRTNAQGIGSGFVSISAPAFITG